MKIKKIAAVCLCFLMFVSFVACGGENAGGDSNESTGATEITYPYTFKDSLGNEITLEKKPETVAVLFSSYADIWKTAGGKVDITVGEAVERGFAESDAILVDSTAGHTEIDLETLVASSPDFVIGTTDYDCQVSAQKTCQSAGIPMALFKVERFSDYLDVLKILCDITGEKENYVKYGTDVEEKVNEIMDKVSSASASKETENILFVRAGSSSKSTKAKTSDDNFVCEMLKELKTKNIADTENELTGNLSLEVILESNPDYLFISTMGDEEAAKDYMDSLLTADGWKELDCVKDNNYTYLPKDLFHFKPNSRWAESYKYLAKILFPEIDFD